MAHVGRGVVVGRAAAAAVLRVRGVRESLAGRGRVVEAEADDAGPRLRDARERGVVGVHEHARRVGQVPQCRKPALGDELELAVAVELVAEQVAEAHRPRRELAHELGKRALVDLEEAELGVAGLEQSRGHSRDEIRAGGVMREPGAGAQDLGRHRRRRRLPVRGRDEGYSERQRGGESADSCRIQRGEELPRQRRPAAAPGQSRQPAGPPCQRRLDSQAHAASVGVWVSRPATRAGGIRARTANHTRRPI